MNFISNNKDGKQYQTNRKFLPYEGFLWKKMQTNLTFAKTKQDKLLSIRIKNDR